MCRRLCWCRRNLSSSIHSSRSSSNRFLHTSLINSNSTSSTTSSQSLLGSAHEDRDSIGSSIGTSCNDVPSFFLPFRSEWSSRNVAIFDVREERLVALLDRCASPLHLKLVHAHLLRHGLDQSNYVITKLLRTFTKLCTDMAYPRLLFRQVRWPNAFLWTALIRGYALNGPIAEALHLYGSMRRNGASPTSFTFSALLKACSAIGSVYAARGVQAHTMMLAFDSDLFVQNTLIDGYVRFGCLSDARKVFDEMPERDVISWTALIVAYARCSDMEAAQRLFNDSPHKDMVAWTAMICSYAQNAKPKEALQLFDRMCAAGVPTDEVTLVGVISACAQLGAASYAKWVHNVAEERGLDGNLVVGSALIDMYAKCGNIQEAYRVFEKMSERNVYSYSAMIVGLAMHGQSKSALEVFSCMKETDVKPNSVTFIGVLTACSHTGMVDEGRHCFTSMQDEYGILPSADHYACMVDLLGRAGRLEEAYEMIKSMPVEPHAGVWGALLGACRIHSNVDLAEIAARQLFKLEPDGIGNHILLSNIYAAVGRWEDVSSVRKMIREKGLKKSAGYSWFEAKDGRIHEFFAGDSSHPLSREIYVLLDELYEKLKILGHVPVLNSVVYDVSDDEKESILRRHSERLALAFGLLSTNPGTTIRIVKNLRICEDCHSFMRKASLVANRIIVVRDNLRFHHFQNGVCSCNDFW
uniref:DYW domain-containing protein n=1 Tax=Nymphaea colorata TaxID=210225 RepID=A0A5K1A2N9_9MAGN